MRRASVTETRREWSKLLSAVEAGESVIITRYGEPVAHLEPPRDATRLLDHGPLRAGAPPMCEGAGEFMAESREDERCRELRPVARMREGS